MGVQNFAPKQPVLFWIIEKVNHPQCIKLFIVMMTFLVR
jgi:hypothetical protein